MLHTDMPPEAKNFLANSLLKSIHETKGEDHSSYTNCRCSDRQADDKCREPFLSFNSQAARYVEREIHDCFKATSCVALQQNQSGFHLWNGYF